MIPKAISTPLITIVRPVNVQITKVSANTSKIPCRPCSTGPSVSAAAWAIAADPRPASLEKALLLRPHTRASFKAIPLAAPSTASGVKAEVTIKDIAVPRLEILLPITIIVKII